MLRLIQTMMMGGNNTSQQNTEIPIRKATIEITKNTVKFGSDVYQFRNVTGFGVCPVRTFKVPLLLIGLFFIVGLFLFIFYNDDHGQKSAGFAMIFIAFLAFIYNMFWPLTYGLKLYLNSGSPLPIFITSDMRGLKKVVAVLYDFMESNEEGRYVVYSNDNSIKIEGGIGGSFTGGNIGGDSSSYVGGNVSRND
ncbi:hypothetical protein [Microcoleus sp. bin38.metabat.b11b12b14.051]|uniref:hypothetical protein n=1 Tax=Microcoleus sp. bin38.metabat.b11b12b14.051 TaxID=2742709 RepID=UPI0025FF216E|nr:hypothetical protein [Microcoleus sp. bin38.metabat.b11b12b14.051]